MTKEFLFKECFLESLLFLIMMSMPVFSSRNDFSIKIARLHDPTHAVAGGRIQLDCEYDLREELLYSVKWYKNKREFYSYLPASIHSIESFPQPGVDVDLSKSGKNNVNLRNLSLESSGNYTCEVCSEAPYFLCKQTTKQLEVIRSRNFFTLNIISLHVPSPVMTGDGILMRCEYDIGQESLHAVKWYKNQRKFYRYVPQPDRENVTYPCPGVNVDLLKSGTNFVYLRNVSLESSGNYTCRVYIDTPYLLYIQKTKQLEVVGPRNASTFKITSLHVPSPVMTGDGIVMRCEYDLGQESLYVVKWYKNNREFYRYVPVTGIEKVAFPGPGVDVDLSKSGTNFVYLRNVSLQSLGNYTCLICSEAPSFLCVQKTKQLEVLSSRNTSTFKITSLHVPTPVMTGDNILLRCEYDLGKDSLYALKWYKNSGEFYRYLPASIQSIVSFSQPGVNVDLSKSGTNFVYIRNVSLESCGNYSCEICSESPSFICNKKTKQLEVIVFPSEGPLLLEVKSAYEMGDNVSLFCVSGKSKLAPDLKWYINDQMVKSDLLDKETVVYLDQMQSTGSALSFRLMPDIFHNGKVTVKCVATIHNISAETTKEIFTSGSSTDA